MKELFIRVGKAGRIVLPKGVRQKLAINPGDFLKILVQGGHVTLRPNRAAAGFVKRGRTLVFSSDAAELLESETVEAVRHQTYSNRSGNIRGCKNSC
jgi:AbrB family looped-hinge helix DNA binding protein